MSQKSPNPAPHAGEKDTAMVQDGQATPSSATPSEADVKDATSPASKPHGTLRDQVQTMESEGQAQPQADELPPEGHGAGIPPLPEPNVEGVGKESGPSAGRGSDKLDRH